MPEVPSVGSLDKQKMHVYTQKVLYIRTVSSDLIILGHCI